MSDSSPAYCSGFRTRAMVCFAPIFFATRQAQQIQLVLRRYRDDQLRLVDARLQLYVAPFPSMLRMSRPPSAAAAPLRSTMVIRC